MLPIYNIVLDNLEGLTKMSLVQAPAVESNFIAFSEEARMEFSVDEEQHNVFGVALRADYPIYRDFYGGCYVVFSKEVINALYQKFMIEDKLGLVSLDHNTDTEGVHLIQSFIKDDTKGINPTGFEDIENGSWFVCYHIDNPNVWDKIKNGEIKGFSVECTVGLEETEQDDLDSFVDELLK